MGEFTMKTYKDSYLYKNRLRGSDNDENKNNKVILDYITNSIRIDKHSEAFAGIVEDIKRQQTSSLVYQILRMENVQLCICGYEMPRSFKVLEAKDPKNNRKPTIFIDCTGLIEYRNGFYICKKIDVLITYIYNALVYLLYRYAPAKIINNSDLLISGTSCYVSLFTYIIDYLRIIGFAENRTKVKYVVGLFYLHNVLGKDLDAYTKNIAARVAGIELKKVTAYDLYLDDDMFLDINIFITKLAETFRLKGLNLQVFMSKWIHLIGIGTQYAVELFTNFGVLLTSAYSGSYIVQQRQIENYCGTDLVKFNNALKTAGVNTFGTLFKEDFEWHDKNTVAKANAIRNRLVGEVVSKKSDFNTIEEATTTFNSIIDFYNNTKQSQKLPKAVLKVFINGSSAIEDYIKKESAYEEGALCACTRCKELRKIIDNSPELEKIMQLFDDNIRMCREIAANENLDKDIRGRASRSLIELMECKNTLL